MRRKNDFYPTPAWATEVLLRTIYVPHAPVLEPCSGQGDIARVLQSAGYVVHTNDIDPAMHAITYVRAQTIGEVSRYGSVITNPPFSEAHEIVSHFVDYGVPCYFMLRLSYLEPTLDRGPWLTQNPPSAMIVLPRISFTGDGKTDSVTCAWMCWNTTKLGVRVIQKSETKWPQ